MVLAGCEPVQTSVLDQCLRQQLFERCMASLPAGPESTRYNDWDDVVSECEDQAMYASYRSPKFVKAECRSSL